MTNTQNILPDPICIDQAALATIPFTNLGIIGTPLKLWFTAKPIRNFEINPDAKAAIQIEMTAGLLFINGQVYTGSNSDGAITIIDSTTGAITVTIHTAAMANVKPGSYFFDLKMRISNTPVDCVQLVQGTLKVEGVVTEST